MTPARGLLFVRPIRSAETLAGGRIVLTQNVREQWTSQQVELVAVGALEVCEDEECEREHEEGEKGAYIEHGFAPQPGAWLLVAPRGFVEVADDVWAMPQANVLAVLEA